MITSNIVPQRPAPSPPYNQHQFNIPVVATNIASGECPGCNEHFAVSEKIYTEEEAAATGGNQATNVMQDAGITCLYSTLSNADTNYKKKKPTFPTHP